MGRPINEELERRKDILNTTLQDAGFSIGFVDKNPLRNDVTYIFVRPHRGPGPYEFVYKYSEKYLDKLTDQQFVNMVLKLVKNLEGMK